VGTTSIESDTGLESLIAFAALDCMFPQFCKNAFLYANNEKTEKEIREIIPFTNSLKNNKVPRNKFKEENQRPFQMKAVNH
jgi:hypothetical protein